MPQQNNILIYPSVTPPFFLCYNFAKGGVGSTKLTYALQQQVRNLKTQSSDNEFCVRNLGSEEKDESGTGKW